MARFYFDHASTTELDPRVKKAMEPYWEKKFGNPSSIYAEGREAKAAIETARKTIADLISARPEEIIFTAGGTESDNLAILGGVRGHRMSSRTSDVPTPHVITLKIEHHAVLRPIEELEKKGLIRAAYLDVDKNGLIDLAEFRKSLTENTILVSIGYANNEIGVIQPIAEISKIIRKFKKEIIFHTDACQAASYLEMNVQKLGVDLMAVNGSKIYGPKGIGFLYARNGIKLEPILYGGGQEKGIRSGTENVPAIVGLAEAFRLVQEQRKKESARLIKIRDFIISELQKKIPEVVLNGHPTKRLPNNVSLSVLNAEGESMVLYLDAKGIAASTGSACTSESLEPSHVIMALGLAFEYAHGSLRFTLGRKNTKKDAEYLIKTLPPIVEKLRQMSPAKFSRKK
ncbi:MAG: cysteine desulfurase family protein [Patescibacteria group bacterium]